MRGGHGQRLPPVEARGTCRPSGEWNDDDFDVLADGVVIGRIFKANAAPVGAPWMWTLAFGHHEGRTPTHGYAATREAAMTAFARVGGGNDEGVYPLRRRSQHARDRT
jgi:hypothetical protein